MCILLYVKLIWCSGIPYTYGQLGGGYICPKYMCIVLYVKHIQHSGSTHLWSIGVVRGTSALRICAFCYMGNLCSVMVLHRHMVNWRRGLGTCAFCYL